MIGRRITDGSGGTTLFRNQSEAGPGQPQRSRGVRPMIERTLVELTVHHRLAQGRDRSLAKMTIQAVMTAVVVNGKRLVRLGPSTVVSHMRKLRAVRISNDKQLVSREQRTFTSGARLTVFCNSLKLSIPF